MHVNSMVLTMSKCALRTNRIIFQSLKVNQRICAYSVEAAAAASPEAPVNIPPPSNVDKHFSSKITSLVGEIAKLNLLEVADLNECLRKTLNIQAAPMMGTAMMAAAPAKAAEEEDEAPKLVQTAFTVKLTKFDDTKKVALIKEVKNIVEGMNLVQAKKFVESVPQVIKANVSKDDAEKLKKALEAQGATISVE
ncbi:39S ribosomal protein L12, mitochondrial [Halotydeus destructor]|nr:39S ribosomal protein L12, mitochondrial [Halotydeus destructor]